MHNSVAPDTAEVVPGVVRLRFVDERQFAVYAYLLTGSSGCVLIDSGFGGDAAADALERQVASIGRSLDEIGTVVLTHLHHDHVGQALRLAERGVTIRFHPEEPTALGPAFEVRRSGLRGLLRAHGMPEEELPDEPYEPPIRLDDPIEDGQLVELAGQRWLAVRTPGHTVGHLCLFRPSDGALIVGDHLLATVSTYVGADTIVGSNILERFLESLDRLDSLPATLVLPAHGKTYRGLHERTAEMRDYYADRLDATAAMLGDDPLSAYDVARLMRETRGRRWDIGAFRRQLLARHTAALLDELARRGRAQRIEAAGLVFFRAR
ncbi:MAG: MBL fold metallo-hydrolase [Dehalococcoidia bacterium]